jgi:hypothetical protein
MHSFLAIVKRKVPAQLLRVSGRAQHEERFSILCLEREGDTPQILLEVLAAESSSPRGI